MTDMQVKMAAVLENERANKANEALKQQELVRKGAEYLLEKQKFAHQRKMDIKHAANERVDTLFGNVEKLSKTFNNSAKLLGQIISFAGLGVGA